MGAESLIGRNRGLLETLNALEKLSGQAMHVHRARAKAKGPKGGEKEEAEKAARAANEVDSEAF